MSVPLSCYYLDEPLTDEEQTFLAQILIGPWARFKTGADYLVQRRVPFVVAAPEPSGQYLHSREHRSGQIIAHLRRAGIRADYGRRVAWLMPRDINWDAIFQFAIRRETGFGPYVVQRPFADDGLAPGQVRVIDTHMLLQGL